MIAVPFPHRRASPRPRTGSTVVCITQSADQLHIGIRYCNVFTNATNSNLDHSRWSVAGLERALSLVEILILRSGYDSGSAGGPGGRGFHGPLRLAPFVIAGWFRAVHGACGRAARRVQAVAIAVAQGQVLEIFSRRRRPLCASRAAACRIL